MIHNIIAQMNFTNLRNIADDGEEGIFKFSGFRMMSDFIFDST